MSDSRADPIVDHLCAIRSHIGELKLSILEVKERLGLLESQYPSISQRVDRMDGRLDLAEA